MSGRIRIGVVVTRFIAGAGGVAFRGIQSLDPDRFEHVIFSADVGGLLARAEDHGIRVVRLPSMRSDLAPLDDLRTFRELTEALRGFDLVHTHSAKAGALGRKAARRAGVRGIVHTLHGFPFHDYQSRLRHFAYLRAERSLGKITDQFLAVGAAVAADAVRLGIASPERIRAIAPAIDDAVRPANQKTRAAARALLGIPKGMRVVGTVGRLDDQKAPLDFVDAVARLAREDVVTVWVGDGPLRARTQRAIDRAGLQARFRLLGERDDVAALLPGFDVFAMASLYEGMPCALAEAMTTGIPAVATTVNSVPEIAIPGRTALLIPPKDPGALAAALGWMLDHPDEAKRMATAARAHLGDRFGASKLAADLEETYARALAGARGSVAEDVDPQPVEQPVPVAAREGLG
jgi:glycosyltransferase involved in cell wall biosynthesis